MRFPFNISKFYEFFRYVAGCACGLSLKLLLSFCFSVFGAPFWVGYLATHMLILFSGFFFHYLITFQRKMEGIRKVVSDFLHYAATVIFFKLLDYFIVVGGTAELEHSLFPEQASHLQQELFHAAVIVTSSGILFMVRFFCFRYLFRKKKNIPEAETEKRDRKYAIGGVAFSGNKGAEGMLLALIQNLKENDPQARFYVMSYYPKTDGSRPLPADTMILNGSPKRVVLNFFLCFYALLCRTLHLPHALLPGKDFKAVAECDFFLDAAGISFCDGREKFTIFNILTILPALALGVPVIKVAQALGPFEHAGNRWMAKRILPRLKWITARGGRTEEYLKGLSLTNVMRFSDIAFSLQCSDGDEKKAESFLPVPRPEILIGISPSQVVEGLCKKNGVEYLAELEKLVRSLHERGMHCVIFPHSARTGTDKRHNNDLPLVSRFAGMVKDLEHITVIEQELEAGELRMLIGKMDVLTASRFHAIVSAMATGVPAAVIGWSHKYAEVLAPFDMERYVQSYDKFSAGSTLRIIEELLAKRMEISARLQAETKKIQQDNQRFFDLLR